MNSANGSPHPSPEDTYYAAVDMLANGNLRGAVTAFRQCLADDSTMLDAMHGLIRALKDLGEIDAAIDAALRLAEVDPDDALAHTSLSILYQAKGMIAEAEAEATKAKLLGWKMELGRQREDRGGRR
jgi:tetratricopeptide (TPR) repeat protein